MFCFNLKREKEMKIQSVNNTNHPRQRFGSAGSAVAGVWVAMVENPMWNLTTIDLADNCLKIAIDKKERNDFAGFETAFREMTGTATVCLSSGLLGKPIAEIANKFVKPEIKTATTWTTEDGLKVFDKAWKNAPGTETPTRAVKFVENIFNNLTGLEGKAVNKWADVGEGEQKYVVETLAKVISDKSITKADSKNILKTLEDKIGCALKSTERIKVQAGDVGAILETSLHNLLRDVVNVGQNLFTNPEIKNIDEGLKKISKVNKIKTFGAVGTAIAIALGNQTINRKLTKSKTGIDNFVGDVDYLEQVAQKKEKKCGANFGLMKAGSALAFAGMVLSVIRPKGFKEFTNRLVLTGPSTGGVAIKTIFATLVLGRIAAAKDKTELRETMMRDSACFINWLVLGGFVSKATANLLDKGRNNLFNEEAPKQVLKSAGARFKNWIGNVSLKSYAEIIAKGGADKTKNIAKLTAAHAAGIAWSTAVFGIGMTKLNIYVTRKAHEKKQREQALAANMPLQFIGKTPEVFQRFSA
jgi:hypothetical protein